MQELIARADKVARLLKQRGETLAVAESSTGGLIAAALLALPGASAYFLGGAVVYTQLARRVLLDIADISSLGIGASTEPLRAAVGANHAATLLGDLGGGGERSDGAGRQSIRRSRRSQLHRCCRTERARDHPRNRERRSFRQHACVHGGRAGPARGRDHGRNRL